MNNNTIHVFSGGGVRGIISLKLIQRAGFLPKMVCGTSAGAIISALRALGVPYSNILQIFRDNIKDIFKERALSFGGMTASKYKSKNLEKVVKRIIGTATNKDCKLDLMINAYDIKNKKPKYWKSWDDEEWSIADAVISSCSAPVYFEPYKGQFVDGGVDSNNICDSALIEAIDRYKENIDLILIGTGEAKEEIKIKSGGFLDWNTRLIDLMLDANQKSAIYKAQQIVEKRGNIDLFNVLNVQLCKNIPLDAVDEVENMMRY